MAGRLPVVRVRATHEPSRAILYFVDERLRELRAVDNPHVRLTFNDVLLGRLTDLMRVEQVSDPEWEGIT